MISPTAEYALRAVVCLGARSSGPQTNHQISEFTKVPAAYLSKVLQALCRAGIVASQRGLKGGYSLTRDMDEITLYEVVSALDPIKRIHTCPLKLPTHSNELCPLHARLDGALKDMEDCFKSATVGEMVKANQDGDACRGPIPLDV